jgi:hypothetical protein
MQSRLLTGQMPMLNTHNYKLDNTYAEYKKAKNRKLDLKMEGYRVKIQKNIEGLFDVWIKDILIISAQQDHGNGRKGNI